MLAGNQSMLHSAKRCEQANYQQ